MALQPEFMDIEEVALQKIITSERLTACQRELYGANVPREGEGSEGGGTFPD